MTAFREMVVVVEVAGSWGWLGSVWVPLGIAGRGASDFSSRSAGSSSLLSSCFSCFFPSFFLLWIRRRAAAVVSLRTSSEKRARSQFFSEADSEWGIGISTRVLMVYDSD